MEDASQRERTANYDAVQTAMTVRPGRVATAVAASVAALHLPPFLHLPVTALLLLLVPVLLFLPGRYLLPGLLPALALAAALRWDAALLPEDCERVPVLLEGRIAGLPVRYDQYGAMVHRVDLIVDDLAPAACAGPRRVRLYLYEVPSGGLAARHSPPDTTSLLPGSRLLVEARLRLPWGTVNPAASAGSRHLLVQGVHAVGSGRRAAAARGPLVTAATSAAGAERPLGTTDSRIGDEPPGPSLTASIDRHRLSLSDWLREEVPSPTGALLAALAVGDQRFIGDADWELLRSFGLTHLLVISGLHVSLLALPGWGLGAVLTRLPGAGRRCARFLPPILALGCAGAYSCLAGLSLPTQRAMLMLALFSLPRLVDRSAQPFRLLALVVLLLAIKDPLSLLGASFWLSLGAVTLLLWCARWQASGRRLTAFAATQAFMLVAMLPLGVFWFDAAAGPGALLNLVAIPLISLLVVPLLLLALLAMPATESVAAALLEVPALSLDVLMAGMRYWQPLLAGVEPAATAQGVAVVLCLAAVLLLPLPPLRGRRAAMGLLAAPFCLATAGGPDSDTVVVVFDVGQGSAVLVRDGKHALLYDTGPGPPGGPPVARRAILPLLRRDRIDDLEMLIVSHADLDHSAGEGLLKALTSPRRVRRGEHSGEPETACRTGRRERLGASVSLLYLAGPLANDSDNNSSCAVLIDLRGHRLLLPGDIDEDRERDLVAYWGDRLGAEVLLAAHHGSGSSSSALFLKTVAPRLLVVSAGRGNRFGHPAAQVLERARARGLTVLNTAFDGALVFSVDDRGQLHCRRLRHRHAPLWRSGPSPATCSAADARGYNPRRSDHPTGPADPLVQQLTGGN